MANVILENVSRVYPGNRNSRANGDSSGDHGGVSDVAAVRDVCLDVNDRELLVLVGPSGSGKSTTLRLIAGLEQPTTGVIRIGDRVVNDVAPKDRDIAMVFQNYALYPHMTVRANMAFGLRLRNGDSLLRRLLFSVLRPSRAAQLKEKRRWIEKQVRGAAEILGIEHLLDRMPSQLSGGERQRVALGRAIVREPALFLFDEPLSNLDAKLRGGMRREIKQLHQRLQTTMIYVTHDQVEAMTLGQRIVVMNDAQIQQVGSPTELYDQPENRFVAGFIGNVPMNFLEGHLERVAAGDAEIQDTETKSNKNTKRKAHEKADHLIFRLAEARLPVPSEIAARLRSFEGQAIVLGIRPEDIVRQIDDRSERLLARLRATARDVDLLGDSTVVHWDLDVGAGVRPILVQAKSEAREFGENLKVQTGEAAEIRFDMSRSHWFDPVSGENVGLNKAVTRRDPPTRADKETTG